ncbi:MAG: hypothetical protein IT423_04585 [Pirellulaceae bacterium]|nr:hypothetical protein [Pirellulaceae bacterium]
MNTKRFDDLAQRAIDALSQYQQGKAELEGSPLTAGDLFVLDSPKPLAAQWCAVLQNLNDAALWYLVPCDDFSLQGSQDVSVPAHDQFDAMNVRCGRGAWMHIDDLPLSRRVGRLAAPYVQTLAQRVTEIAQGTLAPQPDSELVDLDYDYCQWMEQIESAIESMERELTTEGRQTVVLSASQADQNWLRFLPHARAHAADTLAADDMAQEFTAAPGLRLDFGSDCTVIALISPEGVHLHSYDSIAPDLAIGGDDQRVTVKWRKLPKFYQSSLIRWVNGSIIVTCGMYSVTIRSQ